MYGHAPGQLKGLSEEAWFKCRWKIDALMHPRSEKFRRRDRPVSQSLLHTWARRKAAVSEKSWDAEAAVETPPGPGRLSWHAKATQVR